MISISAEMWLAGLIGAMLNGGAHVLLRKRPVSTLARHVIGVLIVLALYTAAFYAQATEPVLSLWICFGLSGVVVGALYTFWHPVLDDIEATQKELAGDIPEPFARYQGGE